MVTHTVRINVASQHCVSGFNRQCLDERSLVEGLRKTSYDPTVNCLRESDDLLVVNGFVNGPVTTGLKSGDGHLLVVRSLERTDGAYAFRALYRSTAYGVDNHPDNNTQPTDES